MYTHNSASGTQTLDFGSSESIVTVNHGYLSAELPSYPCPCDAPSTIFTPRLVQGSPGYFNNGGSSSHNHQGVTPVLPTTLDNMESHSLLGTDKCFIGFDVTWAFPGALCMKKLKNAFVQTLHDYPHVAGRLSCNLKIQQWRIRLISDGVFTTVRSTNLPYVNDEWFQNNEDHPDLVGKLFS